MLAFGARIFLITTAVGVAAAAVAQIPLDLDKIEGGAEDAFDQALVGNAAAVRNEALAIDRNWNGFRSQISHDGATANDIEAMDNAVRVFVATTGTQATSIQLARAANGVSGQIDALFAIYAPSVPPPINRLDYLGREIQLDATEQSFDGAQHHISEAQQVWNNLKPTVIAAGGMRAARDYDVSLETLQGAVTARDATNLVTAAQGSLDQVDLLEQVFTHN